VDWVDFFGAQLKILSGRFVRSTTDSYPKSTRALRCRYVHVVYRIDDHDADDDDGDTFFATGRLCLFVSSFRHRLRTTLFALSLLEIKRMQEQDSGAAASAAASEAPAPPPQRKTKKPKKRKVRASRKNSDDVAMGVRVDSR
jgi:hypothetical protein